MDAGQTWGPIAPVPDNIPAGHTKVDLSSSRPTGEMLQGAAAHTRAIRTPLPLGKGVPLVRSGVGCRLGRSLLAFL